MTAVNQQLYHPRIEKILRFLSSPLVSALVILLAVCARVFLQIHFETTDDDKAYQVQAAQNLLDGNGLRILQAVPGDLSQSQFIPLVKWPPGYSILLAPFLAICAGDFILAAILLDALTAIVFILVARKIAARLFHSRGMLNMYTLVTGFFFYEFCQVSTTDFLALTIFLAAISVTLAMLESGGLDFSRILFLSLLLFYCVFTRYMYLPVVFVIPAYLTVAGLIRHDRSLKNKGLLVGLLLGVLITSYFLVQQAMAGTGPHITDSEKGFFPENLTLLYPFGFSSLFSMNIIFSKLVQLTHLPYATIAGVFVWMHYGLLLLLLFYFIRWMKRKRGIAETLADDFIYLGVLSSLVMLGLLVFLSLSRNLLLTYRWTFVAEWRYFAFPVFFLQLLLFVVAGNYYKTIGSLARKGVKLCFIILAFGCLHSLYYTASVIGSARQSFFARPGNREVMFYTKDLLATVRQENPGKPIILYSEHPFYCNYAYLWYDIPGFYHTILTSAAIRSSQEVILVLMVKQQAITPGDFFQSLEKKNKGQCQDFYFYTTNVTPR